MFGEVYIMPGTQLRRNGFQEDVKCWFGEESSHWLTERLAMALIK